MYLKMKSKKIPIKECNSWKERWKVLKFDLNKIDYALYFPNRKYLSTYFFCQRVDVCFTDDQEKILYIHRNVKSEKRIIHPKAKNIWILPLNTTQNINKGDQLIIMEEKNGKKNRENK